MSIALDDMSPYARSVVDRLGLEAHPEGGWYTRDWQSPRDDAASGRPLASLIYFLLPQGDASAWHKVDADELWLWHGPATVTLELGGSGDAPAADDGKRTRIVLGAGVADAAQTATVAAASDNDDDAPICGHAVVPAGVWQRTVPGTGDALVSCVVSPGFVFEGFTLE
ncbi:hypothetical protein DSM100688_1188 [Bifidobacterium ramosum]|uniref:Cupin domain-containing protein n=1 Tax=Bifidobacterium ramosum TaxID=1798158 RepID=A0A6L4X099_9BIFI|nr:cupin domain-containing protein [Bifidobacterium ramosum]KAB8288078.1 hypothetical protein DSM100688_1188 [Bifidobacterium ramosum]NEG72702.1 cupin domain-containing protein [Bifidobacterium ramosum]